MVQNNINGKEYTTSSNSNYKNPQKENKIVLVYYFEPKLFYSSINI